MSQLQAVFRRNTRHLFRLLPALLMMALLALGGCGGSAPQDTEDEPPATIAGSIVVEEPDEDPTEEIIIDAVEAVTPVLAEDPPVVTVAPGGDISGEEPGEQASEPTSPPATPAPRNTPTPRPTPDFGSVAYDVPTEMVRGEIVQVILLVSPNEDEQGALTAQLTDELAEVDQTPSNVITATVRTAKRMSAQLSAVPSDAFDIVPLQTSNVQFLDDEEPTKWEWSVRPLTGGTHQLSLVIERFEMIDGEPALRGEESYRDEITVAVPPGQRALDIVASPLAIAAFLGLVAVLGLLAVLRRRSATGPAAGRPAGGTLSREQLHRVTPILADALAQLTAEQRVAFLSQAGVGHMVDVDLNGSARTVAMTILSELNAYGSAEDGRPAILLLLDYLAANPALPRRDKATLDEITAT